MTHSYKFSVIGDMLESVLHDQMPPNNCVASMHMKVVRFNSFLSYNMHNLRHGSYFWCRLKKPAREAPNQNLTNDENSDDDDDGVTMNDLVP